MYAAIQGSFSLNVDFPFSDTIAGYACAYDSQEGRLTLRTTDSREFTVYITPQTSARYTYNLNEPYDDVTSEIARLLASRDQFLYAYGTFYPCQNRGRFEAQWLVFPGDSPGVYRHEEPNWWVNQARSIATSYLKWQFNYPEEPIDYRDYRTMLNLAGGKNQGDYLQETDTISRMVYGLASAYMLTGEEPFLEAAETGCEYLRSHMRFYDQDEDIIYWYHGIRTDGEKETKLLTSEFGDDYYSIPIYEQIYALVGLTMTYRLTGDPRILWDIERTVAIFGKFKDPVNGGYFSHIDPLDLDPRAESLAHNRARKNWNSIGDHAPAYLFNLYLATQDSRYLEFLEDTFDMIVAHFPDHKSSPFVNERFHEDWRHDTTWGWQQNRAVVGHNLKMAWNLMRMASLKAKDEYVDVARRIADAMPQAGSDRQRGGWYDVLERVTKPDGRHHRFVWHDRKAWWQQEQAILAYTILHGILREEFYLRMARESASFYNAFFLDHDDGGVYFNTFANGLPYLLGTERFKGSHSMSAYHSIELCLLATVYTNLLVKSEGVVLYFRPYPAGFPDNVLYVSPDVLPRGAVHIAACSIDGEPFHDVDASRLAIRLPTDNRRHTVRVELSPGPCPRGG